MNIQQIIADLKRDEGFRGRPYDDATGHDLRQGDAVQGKITVGIGRNLSDVGLDSGEAEYLLQNDIVRAQANLDRVAPFWKSLPEAVQNALVNMSFNLGGKLAQFKNMLGALEAGDFKRAATEAENSAWADQVGDRAKRIVQIFRNA